MNINELYWAAGFFDGEGNVGFAEKGKKFYIQISQKSTNVEVLERFKSAVDNIGMINTYKDGYASTGRKAMYQVSSKEALNVINLILPYLSSAKREQANHAVLIYKNHKDKFEKYCRNGHERTSSSLTFDSRGNKMCRICHVNTNKKSIEKRRLKLVG